MSLNRNLLTLALGLSLAACSTTPAVKVPEKVYITVEKYVPLPPDLVKDCYIAEPVEMTVGEAVRIAKERKTSLLKCNEDKAALRKLGQ